MGQTCKTKKLGTACCRVIERWNQNASDGVAHEPTRRNTLAKLREISHLTRLSVHPRRGGPQSLLEGRLETPDYCSARHAPAIHRAKQLANARRLPRRVFERTRGLGKPGSEE